MLCLFVVALSTFVCAADLEDGFEVRSIPRPKVTASSAQKNYPAGMAADDDERTMRVSDGWKEGDAYERTPWFVAMHYPGCVQISLGKKLLEEYPWWRFESHPEWVEPHSSTHSEPHPEWYDNHKKWAEMKGRSDLPFAAGIPGQVRFIYMPGNDSYKLVAPTVRQLEPDVDYRAFLFEPMWGKRIDLGKVRKTPSGQTMEYQPL